MRVDLNHIAIMTLVERKKNFQTSFPLSLSLKKKTKDYLDSTSYILINEILPVMDNSVVWPKGYLQTCQLPDRYV